MNIPNWLTFIRICMIPVFVLVYYLPWHWAGFCASMFYLVAAFTDWLDGFLARRLHQSSKFGAFLDPVADKLMVAIALVLITSNPMLPYTAIPAAVIIGREIAISALREWMAELGKRAQVKVGAMGKYKTAAQMISIAILIGSATIYKLWILIIGYSLLYAAAVLTLWSMCIYLRAAWPNFDFTTPEDKEL